MAQNIRKFNEVLKSAFSRTSKAWDFFKGICSQYCFQSLDMMNPCSKG